LVAPSVAAALSAGVSDLSGVMTSARYADDAAVQQPVAREREGIDLDLGLLALGDKADVAVGNHRFDLELTILRHGHGERLHRRHHAADGVHRDPLHDADRRRELLKIAALFRLDDVLLEAGDFLLGLGQIVEHGAAELGRGLPVRVGENGNRG
jgi:hypothetical protein